MLERAIAQFRPRQRCRTLDWARVNVQSNDDRPYDHWAYPHTGAPGGPFDAFDCPQYLTISCQFGSQIAKTFGGLCCLMKVADTDPSPMMFVSSDQKLAVEEVTTKLYPMLARCVTLRDQLRPESRRKQDLVELGNCRIFVGWARSVSTLASKAIRVGHANEIDKWEHQKTSKEADPLKLFTDRFKSFPSHKIIFESTPALKATSRIERLRLASTNCAYYVPCPKCWRYQLLRMGDGKEPGGIVWAKNAAGKSEKELTRRTARYVCLHCQSELGDEYRGPMMRNGVWIAEGCGCDDDKALAAAERTRKENQPPWRGWKESDWITGEPMRDGRDAGYQLSSLYSLQIGWGRYAAEFIDSKGHPENLRNFVNQWEGLTWEYAKRKATWEAICLRLLDKTIQRGIVPQWASIVTIGVDRQLTDNKHPWVADAWGPGPRSATIDYGECSSLEEIEQTVAMRAWRHADGGPVVVASMVFIDSGNRPLGVHELCERLQVNGVPALPCKGSAKALASDYDLSVLGPNTSRPGATLCMVDTIRSQLWIDRALHDADKESAAGFALFSDQLFNHQDFIQQLLNDGPVEDTDAHNNARESWDRIDKNTPNDYRDCKRYSYCAMLLATNDGRMPIRGVSKPKEQPRPVSRVRELRIRR